MENNEKSIWWPLIGFLIICFAAEAGASWWTEQSVATWYPTLVKPFWTPPSWLFGPVWTVLYGLMAISAWILWRQVGGLSRAPLAFTLFFIQLILNYLWSQFFFGWQEPQTALLDIIALWVMLTATIWAFNRHSGFAAALLIPYWLWVAFAFSLNAAIVWLNR